MTPLAPDALAQLFLEARTHNVWLDRPVADETLRELSRLLQEQARHIDPVDLERARNQIAVRQLRAQEQPLRRLEDAALELFSFGRLRPAAEALARIEAIDGAALQAQFARMLGTGATLALAGKLPRAASERAREAAPELLRS